MTYKMKKTALIALSLFLFLSIGCQANNESKKEDKAKIADKGEKHYTQKIGKAEFIEKVWNYEKNKEWNFEGDKPVIIDFYADWCGPCKVAAPILEEIAKEYDGKIQVYKINTDEQQELSQIFQIRSIPAFLYIPMKGKPSMSTGFSGGKQGFIKAINELLLPVAKTE